MKKFLKVVSCVVVAGLLAIPADAAPRKRSGSSWGQMAERLAAWAQMVVPGGVAGGEKEGSSADPDGKPKPGTGSGSTTGTTGTTDTTDPDGP